MATPHNGFMCRSNTKPSRNPEPYPWPSSPPCYCSDASARPEKVTPLPTGWWSSLSAQVCSIVAHIPTQPGSHAFCCLSRSLPKVLNHLLRSGTRSTRWGGWGFGCIGDRQEGAGLGSAPGSEWEPVGSPLDLTNEAARGKSRPFTPETAALSLSPRQERWHRRRGSNRCGWRGDPASGAE